MVDIDRTITAQAADLAAVIERATSDLALGEEAGSFLVALEEGARDD
jgi:hypothetical protein